MVVHGAAVAVSGGNEVSHAVGVRSYQSRRRMIIMSSDCLSERVGVVKDSRSVRLKEEEDTWRQDKARTAKKNQFH